jgi:hypothetical protein
MKRQAMKIQQTLMHLPHQTINESYHHRATRIQPARFVIRIEACEVLPLYFCYYA